MHRSIRAADDVLAMLDRLFTSNIFWDAFYADRGKPPRDRPPVPFLLTAAGRPVESTPVS